LISFSKNEKKIIAFLSLFLILGITLKLTGVYNLPNKTKKVNNIDNKFEKLASLYKNTDLKPNIININTSSEKELQRLKGIGPKIAKRIVEYRKKNGKFNRIEEIINIKGIGEKKFNIIKDRVSVTGK